MEVIGVLVFCLGYLCFLGLCSRFHNHCVHCCECYARTWKDSLGGSGIGLSPELLGLLLALVPCVWVCYGGLPSQVRASSSSSLQRPSWVLFS